MGEISTFQADDAPHRLEADVRDVWREGSFWPLAAVEIAGCQRIEWPLSMKTKVRDRMLRQFENDQPDRGPS